MAEDEAGWKIGGQDEGHDDVDSQGMRARVEGIVRDVLKKTVTQSSGARQVTEDVIRAVASEVKMPREVAQYVLGNADTVKNEIVRVVATEIRRFLETANLGDELARILTSISFEVKTEIRFVPNDEAIRPSVRSRVGVRSVASSDVIAESGSEQLDNAVRAGLSEFLGKITQRAGAGASPFMQRDDAPRQAEEPPHSPEEERAARRDRLRQALARRRDD